MKEKMKIFRFQQTATPAAKTTTATPSQPPPPSTPQEGRSRQETTLAHEERRGSAWTPPQGIMARHRKSTAPPTWDHPLHQPTHPPSPHRWPPTRGGVLNSMEELTEGWPSRPHPRIPSYKTGNRGGTQPSRASSTPPRR